MKVGIEEDLVGNGMRMRLREGIEGDDEGLAAGNAVGNGWGRIEAVRIRSKGRSGIEAEDSTEVKKMRGL
ncbi:unnamed protein product [Linum trigynum]|uniref:Uncharacterized protein n=1 Tax=Linum trigynum TaxID=586398 RepID=A0AAV2G7Z1_9ROSI